MTSKQNANDKRSAQVRIEQIANGFLLRPGGMPIYCEDADELEKRLVLWMRLEVKKLAKEKQ